MSPEITKHQLLVIENYITSNYSCYGDWVIIYKDHWVRDITLASSVFEDKRSAEEYFLTNIFNKAVRDIFIDKDKLYKYLIDNGIVKYVRVNRIEDFNQPVCQLIPI